MFKKPSSSSSSSPYPTTRVPPRLKHGPGASPGRHGWRSPGPAAGRPPWPPRCSSSRCRPCPTSECRCALPGPPPGPRKGYDHRSDAAAGHKNSINVLANFTGQMQRMGEQHSGSSQSSGLKSLSPETSVHLPADRVMQSGSSPPTMGGKQPSS